MTHLPPSRSLGYAAVFKCLALAFSAIAAWTACGTSAAPAAGECNDGETRACTCSDSVDGMQTCGPTRAYGTCVCKPSTQAACPGDAERLDGGSPSGKKCQVCDFDVAPTSETACPATPACGNGSLGVPAESSVRDDLATFVDNGVLVGVDAGAPAENARCLPPQLRVRIQKLDMHAGGGEGYCIVEATDGVTSAAAMTMKTAAIGAGDDFPFPVDQALLWGQRRPECTSNNLTLTYYCFKVIDNSTWSAAAKAMGDTAVQFGGSPFAGQYGWAFGLGGAASNAVAAGITAAQKDEIRIKIQQTIPANALLDLTNGRTWSVRSRVKEKCTPVGCLRDFDWELTLQAWGCAEKLPDAPH